MAFLSNEELKALGFKYLGRNVKISEKASIYNPGKISIGDNTRIDDFCILSAGSGGIDIGRYVHIACFASLIGREKITLEDFSGIAARGSVYSSCDDFSSGNFMTNPTVPEEYTNVRHAPVVIKKHGGVGAGTIVLPGVTIGVGAIVGALSLVMKDIEEFTLSIGIPAKKIKNRRKAVLELEKIFLSKIESL